MYAELSNFIKAICHPGGHWSWAPRSPGTKRGGLVSPAPMWGKWSAFLTVYTLNTGNKQVTPIVLITDTSSSVTCMKSVLSGWNIMSSIGCWFNVWSKKKNIIYLCTLAAYLDHFKIAVCLLSMEAHKHVLLRSVKALSKSIWLSFTKNYALNVIVWAHVSFLSL